MFPIKELGGFERVVKQVEGNRTRVVGVLLADLKQEETRSYILNYLTMLDQITGKDINFYIPGYVKTNKKVSHEAHQFELNDDFFNFNRKKYNLSLQEIMKNYDVQNPFTPTLLLLQWNGESFEADQYISIDLDKGNDSIKYSLVFLKDILQQKDILDNLYLIHDYLAKQRYAKYMKEEAINDLGIGGLPVIIRTYQEVKKYFISDPKF